MDTSTPRESAPAQITAQEILTRLAEWLERELRVYGRTSEGYALAYLMGMLERHEPEAVARLQAALDAGQKAADAKGAAR
jgi:hypothetical protein